MGNDIVIVTLWLHGTIGNLDSANGDVDIIEFSGQSIGIDVIDKAIKDAEYFEEWLHGLPTERWLRVSIKLICEEDSFWLEAVGFEEADI